MNPACIGENHLDPSTGLTLLSSVLRTVSGDTMAPTPLRGERTSSLLLIPAIPRKVWVDSSVPLYLGCFAIIVEDVSLSWYGQKLL